MLKQAFVVFLLIMPTLAIGEEQTPAKPSRVCNTNCQPLGNHQICSKYCWSYQNKVFVQSTATWTTGVNVAKKTSNATAAAAQ